LLKLKVQIPEKLGFLFSPKRYKIAYGGRGSTKSWSFARALLVLGYSKPVRILCAREVQRSIKQSVHQLLVDQIQLLDLGKFYEVTETQIRGANGTLINFAGLAQQSVESIKSFEGVDIVWVEEAQTVSKRSWSILIPTIRKPGSEIWLTFNPDLDTDDTYTRFVENTPPNSEIVKINYDDNPWLSDEMEQERLHCKETEPDDYPNIWEGMCKAAVDGAIFAKEITESQEKGRICNVPYDSLLKVHIVFDLGWNDAMAISLVQRSTSEIRVIEYWEDSHKTLEHYSNTLKAKNLNWGTVFLPHDGKAQDFKTGKSAVQIMKGWGWNVETVSEMSIEAGIKLARMTFPRVYIDKSNAYGLVNCLKRYKRIINSQTNEPGTPLHDEYSHGADNFRYICISADQMNNHAMDVKMPEISVGGWMG